MKRGTYQSRRRIRKIKRFIWVFKLRLKKLVSSILTTLTFYLDIVLLLIILIARLIFRFMDKLFIKQLIVIKRGEIYEGIKK